MGIFIENRTQLSESTGLPYVDNERYNGNMGIATMVAETYSMDQALFEAVMKRDVIVMQEGDGSSTDKNFFEKLWDKVIEATDWIKAKIKSLVESFYSKLDKWKKDRLIKKLNPLKKKLEQKNDADLVKLEVKNYKGFDTALIGKEFADKISTALKTHAEINKYSDKNKDQIAEISRLDVEKQIWASVAKQIGAGVSGDSYNEVKTAYENALHPDSKKNDHPFGSEVGMTKKALIDALTNCTSISDNYCGGVRATQKALNEYLDKQKREAQKEKRKFKKAESEDGVAQAKLALRTINQVQSVGSKALGLVMNGTKEFISSCWSLLPKAANFTAPSESYGIDNTYLDLWAIEEGESLDLYMDAITLSEGYGYDDNDYDDNDDLFSETTFSFI